MTDQFSLNDAEKVIECFGGIRPMAKKMNVAVTTVQGWKKRQTIPPHRVEQVIEAAKANQIDLSAFLSGSASNVEVKSVPQTPKPTQNESAVAERTEGDFSKTLESVKGVAQPGTTQSPSNPVQQQAAPSAQVSDEQRKEQERIARISRENAAMIEQLRKEHASSFAKNITVSVIMVAITGAILAFIFWPAKKQISDNNVQIAELSNDVKKVKKSHSRLKKLVPENLGEKFVALQEQAEELQTQVKEVGEQASEVMKVANDVLNADVATMGERLSFLEMRLNEIADESSALGGLLDRVDALQESVSGQDQLSKSVQELNRLFSEFQAASNVGLTPDITIDDALETAQKRDTALGDTLAGVPGNDLKAAAYLIGLSKLRSSLNRDNTPFSEDLALMHKFVGKDNPELQAAMVSLAPKAEQGVLTTQGLKEELKGLTGDIVVASLKGEDVTIQERAEARLSDFISVEKDGEQITGTQTQKTITKAQALLDSGDVEGAIATLQSLDGDAATAAQPWINEAESTLASQQLQELLVQQLLGKLESSGGGPVHFPSLGNIVGQEGFNPGSLNLDRIIDAVPGDIPLDIDPTKILNGQGRVVRDEKSGVTVLTP